MEIRIGTKIIGEKKPSFVIAEAGINHNGKLRIAKELVYKAKKCGSDAVKFQSFKAGDLASEKSPYFKLFKKLELTDEDYGELSDHSKSNGIIFIATPFSEQAVEMLHKLKVPAYKIASGDLTDLPLIKYASKKGKPMIISTGMGSFSEIKEAINTVKSTNNKKMILLHSHSSYPTPPEEANLAVISTLKKFGFHVGYSDNGGNQLVPIIAVRGPTSCSIIFLLVYSYSSN